MRKEFIEDSEIGGDHPSQEMAQQYAPWAAVILPAIGGFWAFESVDDADTWERQI